MTAPRAFFAASLAQTDPEIHHALEGELKRQREQIELIASENIVSRAVLQAQGSVLTNKYAEGYAGKRYYGGCEEVDKAETLAIARARALFGAGFVNVQPHSGAQANNAVFLALVAPGDTVLGMALSAGGHLTHGAAPSLSGKWFKAVQYGVKREDGLIDYEQVEQMAREHRPKLLIAGYSAYTRVIDWARLRGIADSVGAFFMADMAHVAGLVATGHYPSPVPHAHVTTTTTHKTLRGPRGGMILCNDEAIAKKIDSAIFPGSQGGPLMHVIAAKAVALHEAMQPDFKQYGAAMIANARALGAVLMKGGLDLVTGGTDNHMLLVDLRPIGVKGNEAASALEAAGLTCNKNAVPFDTEKPTITSGIRIGSPAATTRGFGIAEFEQIGAMILATLSALKAGRLEQTAPQIRAQVQALCARFPIY